MEMNLKSKPVEKVKEGDIVIFDIHYNPNPIYLARNFVCEIGVISRLNVDANGDPSERGCQIIQPNGRMRARNYVHDLQVEKMIVLSDGLIEVNFD